MAEQTPKEWLDEFVKKTVQKAMDGGYIIVPEDLDRLISMSRKAEESEKTTYWIGYRQGKTDTQTSMDEFVDKAKIKVERYEKALKDISDTTISESLDDDSLDIKLVMIATEALDDR